MIVWTPIAVNEDPMVPQGGRHKPILPEYSAAVIGSSVVLRVFSGGLTSLSLALTTVPFATPDEARVWVESNKKDETYRLQIPASTP